MQDLVHPRPERPRGALLGYFSITYAVTWACWMASIALSRGAGPTPPVITGMRPLFLLGTFAPGLIALAFTARASGRAGVEALLRRILRWEVGARWYVFALGYMAAIKLTVVLVYRLAMGAWPQFGSTPWYIMLLAVAISTWVQAGEEIGWRGYALPRLAVQIGLGPASVLLGVIWACWHLPLFLIPGADTSGQSFPLYLLQVTALSVAMAWLYWRTGGSLLLVMLLHAAVNNTKDIVPSAVAGATNPFALSTSLVAWLTVTPLWICAAYFLLRMRGAALE